MRDMAAPLLHRAYGPARRLTAFVWEGLSHLLWPPVCAGCGLDMARADGNLCKGCWGELLSCTAGDYCPRCGRDASPYGLVAGVCPACQGQEIHFDRIARAGVYTGALQRLILAFKNGRSELDAVLAPLSDAALKGGEFYGDIEVLVPVPLHWTRRLARGYNQSHLIARRLKHPAARIYPDLVRVRRTRPQPVAATPAARARNVAGAFAVRSDHRFAGRTVCLIDDIKTSGATLNECAKTLKEAGAARVYALTLAVAGQKL